MSEGRMPLVAGNWKMYLGPRDTRDLITDMKFELSREKGLDGKVEIAICPSFVSLEAARDEIYHPRYYRIKLGAQNVYYEEPGAYTGETSIDMLADDTIDCDFCIVGHSERRQIFGETDSLVAAKALALHQAGINPIVCVGDSADDRDVNDNYAISAVLDQLELSLDGLTPKVIAYEPVWAIGTGKAATPKQAEQMCYAIRGKLETLYGKKTAEVVRILYGGSVNPGNALDFASQPNIDGALVGGSALDAKKFIDIVKAFA